jgi:hypothetical protein
MPYAWCSAGQDITCFIVGIVTSLQAWVFGVWFLGMGKDSSPFSKIPSPVQLVPSFFPRHATGHSLPSGAKVKNKWSCTSAPPVWICGMVMGVLWNLSVHHSVYNSLVLNGTQNQHHPVQYARLVCQRPTSQVLWFTFCTFYFIFHIRVTCLSCPWLLLSHNCNFGWTIYLSTPSQLSWAYE